MPGSRQEPYSWCLHAGKSAGILQHSHYWNWESLAHAAFLSYREIIIDWRFLMLLWFAKKKKKLNNFNKRCEALCNTAKFFGQRYKFRDLWEPYVGNACAAQLDILHCASSCFGLCKILALIRLSGMRKGPVAGQVTVPLEDKVKKKTNKPSGRVLRFDQLQNRKL